MAEKIKANTDLGFEKKYEQLRAELRGKSESELLRALRERMEEAASSEQELAPEVVRAYYDAMDEQAPLAPMPFDFEASWSRFTRENPEFFEDAPETAPEKEEVDRTKNELKRTGRMKLLLVVAAAVVVCSIAAMAADLSETWYFWKQDVLGLEPASGNMSLAEPNEDGFCTLDEALAAYGVVTDSPGWVPERYHLDEISVTEEPDVTVFTASYISTISDERSILVRVSYSEVQEFPYENYETDVAQGESSYSFNGCEAVITTNEGYLRASCYLEDCVITITGSLSELELKQMLRSIIKE